jgi:hypothetical protein
MFILYGRRKGDTLSMYWDTAVGDELTLHPLFTGAQALKVVNNENRGRGQMFRYRFRTVAIEGYLSSEKGVSMYM